MQLIDGEKVVVRRREEVGRDPGNNPIYEWVSEEVENVLVAPGPRNDVDASNRPDGVQVSWNLHMPKTFTGSLRGCEISVRGLEPAPVIGDPHTYTDSNNALPWNRPVELERIDG